MNTLLFCTLLVAQADGKAPPFATGTWELFGTGALTLSPTAFDVEAGAGYFLAPPHEVGGVLGLHVDGVEQYLLAPFYRFHLYLNSSSVVPYLGAMGGITILSPPGGGPKAQGGNTDTNAFIQGMGGLKLMGSPRWSLLVDAALRYDFDAEDLTFILFAGFSVYL